MTLKKILAFTLLFQSLLLTTSFAQDNNWQEDQSKGAKLRVIGSFYQDSTDVAKPDKKLLLGMHFIIKDGWKIYGPDSLDVGLPPIIDFEGSENYLSHKILWPKAILEEEVIDKDLTLKYSAYKNEVIIPIEVSLSDLSNSTSLNIKVNYGLCKDICVPAEAKFNLKISPDYENKTFLSLLNKYDDTNIINDAFFIEKPVEESAYLMLLTALLAAFIGGIILNLMPCVLPVLSIKLISIIKSVDADVRRIRLAFLSTIVGILFCFLALAAITILLKIGGHSLGFGLQFQNPYFLVFLILVLIFFTLNLLGFFEVTFDQFVANLLNKKIVSFDNDKSKKRNIFVPNFLSGILAVLLATPCSAPFLGSAISFALSQSNFDILAIFLAIGLGVAFPYLILIAKPTLVYILPKPGKWMLFVKKLMAFFLLITIAWLLFILMNNSGIGVAIAIVAFSSLITFSFAFRSKNIMAPMLAALVILSFLTVEVGHSLSLKNRQILVEKNNLWIPFNEKKIGYYVAQGKVVVIDVTADWCLTCKLNKKLVLDSKEFMVKLNNPNVIAMRADITRPNKVVMDFLRSHNRFAIPFNVVYGPNARNGLLTKELLKKQELVDLIEMAK